MACRIIPQGMLGNFNLFLCHANLMPVSCEGLRDRGSPAFLEAQVGWMRAVVEAFEDTGRICESIRSVADWQTVFTGQLWMKMTWHSTTTRNASLYCCTWRSTRPTWTWRCTSWRKYACKNMGGAISCPWRSVLITWLKILRSVVFC